MKKILLIFLCFPTVLFGQVVSDVSMKTYNDNTIINSKTPLLRGTDFNLLFDYIIDSKLHKDSIDFVGTASNLGTGYLVMKMKSNDTLYFYSISSLSSAISLTQGTNELQIDLDETQINHNLLLNYDAARHFLKSDINLNDLGDVTISSPVDDQVLKYSGGTWINATGSGSGEQMYSDTTREVGYDATYFYVDSLIATVGLGELNWSDTTGNLATDYDIDTLKLWIINEDYLQWADTSGNLTTDFDISLKQNISDTSSLDATRYWVFQQGYLDTESDPIWVSDSIDYLHKSDTVNKVATVYWVNNQGYLTDALQWVDTTTVGGVGLATAYDLTQLGGTGEQMYADTTRNIGYDATYYYVDSLAATLGGGGLNWSDTTGNLATDYDIDTLKQWVVDEDYLKWTDTTGNLATDYNLTLKQNVSDTSTKDATRYWVGQQGFLDWGDTTQVGGIGVATAYDLSLKMSDPMTTRGDIIYRNSSNTTTRLGRGVKNTLLTSDGTDISWELPPTESSDLFDLFPAIFISNLQGNNLDTVGEDKFTIIDKSGVSSGWIKLSNTVPWVEGLAYPDANNTWGMYVNDYECYEVDSICPTRDTVFWSGAAGTLNIGEKVFFFNPFRRRNITHDWFPDTTGLNPPLSSPYNWGSGMIWQHSDGSYRFVMNGWATVGAFRSHSYLYRSDDLLNWDTVRGDYYYRAGTAPFNAAWISSTGNLSWMGNPIKLYNSDLYIGTFVTTNTSAKVAVAYAIFDEDFNVKYVSSEINIPGISNTSGNGGLSIVKYQGYYWAYLSHRATSNDDYSLYEMKLGDLYSWEVLDTTMIAKTATNKDTWNGKYIDVPLAFVYNDNIYILVGGTGHESVRDKPYYGNRTYGLYKKNGNTWEEYMKNPVLSVPIEGETIWGSDLLWQTDHTGGYFSMIIKQDSMLFFASANNGTNTYHSWRASIPLKDDDLFNTEPILDISNTLEWSDTTSYIATQYDINGMLEWADTSSTPGLATQYDLTQLGGGDLSWSDTTAVGGVGLTTAYDISDMVEFADTSSLIATKYDIEDMLYQSDTTGIVATAYDIAYKQDESDTTRNVGYDATYFYVDSLAATLGGGGLNWSDTTGNLATDYDLTFKQDISDTNNWDATRYWVELWGFLQSEEDPVWTSDSVDYLSKWDTNNIVASRYWVDQQGYITSGLEWSDTTTTPGLATQYDLTLIGGGDLSWSDTTVVGGEGLATAYDLTLKQNVSDTSTLDATRFWVNQQDYLLWADTSNQLATDYNISTHTHTAYQLVTDTTTKDATRYWVGQQGYITSGLEWADTTVVGGVGLATAYDLTLISGGDLSWTDTTEVDGVGLATAYDLTAKQNVSDTSSLDATRYWVGQQGYGTGDLEWSDTTQVGGVGLGTAYDLTLKQNVSDTTTKDATRYWVELQGYGNVNLSDTNTPVNNQIALWNSADSIIGSPNLTYQNGVSLKVEEALGGDATIEIKNTSGDSPYNAILSFYGGTNTANITWSGGNTLDVYGMRIQTGLVDLNTNSMVLTTGAGTTTAESIECAAIKIGASSQTVKEAGTLQYTGGTLQYYNGSGWLTPLTAEVDGSISNEGSLGVGAGGADDATVTSNTSGSSTVTFTAGTNVDITENTSTPSITIATESDVVDYTGTQASGNVSYFTEDGNTISGEAALTYSSTSNTLTVDTVYSSIKLNRATTTYSGTVRLYTTGAAGVTAYNLVYLSGDNTVLPVDRDAVGTAKTLGMALETKTSGQQVRIITDGIVYNSSWNWTAGGYLYNSSTAGEITTTVPATAGYGQRVAIAVDADRIEIQIGSLVGF